ncbi:MAG TPA: LysE family translocator [Pseudonocardia sp.]|jgi:threonine/homoserine/homoserine lactone efflux protein|uniref:LysE family translocator n=1 Tax=Pseudonocardia sp. TaxID=60912 RepID=UPI002F3E2956
MSIGLAVFLPVALAFALSPGAGNFLAMRNGARFGARVAILGFAGRFVSFLLLLVAVVGGLGAIIVASSTALTVIKWCGASYLVFLGLQSLWAHRHRRSPEPEPESGAGGAAAEPAATGAGLRQAVRQEFLISITNPKALLLFTAFLPQFVLPGAAAPPQLALLGGIYIGLEFVAACGWARLGHVMSGDRVTVAVRRRFGQFTGVVLLGTGAWLASFSARTA